MERPLTSSPGPSPNSRTIRSQKGISLIAIIGILGVVTIGMSLVTPNLVRTWNHRHSDREDQHLSQIGGGIQTYLEQNKAYPPSLGSLSPDYVPLSSAQLTENDRGYPRYYFVHPTMSSFDDAVGLSAIELPDARVLLISNLTRDESPTITNASEFETWWTTDESSTEGLHINRTNVGFLFHQLTIDQDGDGGSYQLNGTTTDSGGGPLALHSNYHLTGTTIQFDEADTYVSPEVQFALTTNTSYWFDPSCVADKRWNPLDPDCGSTQVLWLSTTGTTSGTPGISWNDSATVAFDNPNLAYQNGPTSTTNGTFSAVLDMEDFTSTTDVDGIHYVTKNITVGVSSTVNLMAGDVLISLNSDETMNSTNSLTVDDNDIFIFHPDITGDYSSGTFTMLLDESDIGYGSIIAFSLVEDTTTVGGIILNTGDFLLSESGEDVGADIDRFVPNHIGTTTSGTTSVLVDGSDINISGENKNINGIHLVTNSLLVGDVTLQAGEILTSLTLSDSSTGDNNISTDDSDIFILDVTTAGSSTVADATLFFDASDVNMSTSSEDSDGITLAIPGAVLPPPTCTAAGTNSGFEDSTALLGWSKTSGSGGVTDDTAGGDVTPTEGSKQAVMHNKANPASASAMASFLGFSTSALDSALTSAFGFSVSLGGGVAIKQSITVAAGDRIAFDWDFLDDGADKDLGFAVFDGNIIALDSSPASGPSISDWVLESSDVDEVGSWESWTGKQHSTYSTANYTFSSGGTFEIAFAVMNKNGDDDGLAGLVVDNVCNIGP